MKMSYCLKRYFKTVLAQSKTLAHCKQSKSIIAVRQDDQQGENKQLCGAKPLHIPVMANEVLDILDPKPAHTIIDMTFGGGGHSQMILQRAASLKLIAADRDPLAFRLAQSLSQQCTGSQLSVVPVLGRFSELPHNLSALGIEKGSVDSFLFDLGASSMQYDTPERGFSLSRDGPLDMRMDGDRFPDDPTAADVVNNLDANDLHSVFRGYGEERLSRSIAQAIVDARYAFGNITRTQQLAKIVDTVFEGNHKQDKLQRHSHPATKVYQALRILVNNELNELHNGLEVAWQYLRPGGRCVVIAFHSLEDRIVKRHFHGIEMDAQANMRVGDHHRNSAIVEPVELVVGMLSKRWKPVSRKVLTPTGDEISSNPRCRSAKLRAATKR